MAVNAGAHLGELHSLQDLYSWRLLALGGAMGAAALAPILLKRWQARPAAAGAAGADGGKQQQQEQRQQRQVAVEAK